MRRRRIAKGTGEQRMTRYKVVFDVVECDRIPNTFMNNCGFSEDYGIKKQISYVTSTKPTNKYINTMIDKMNCTKDCEEFNVYYAGVSLNRVEVIADD
jgi:hypothetical protein